MSEKAHLKTKANGCCKIPSPDDVEKGFGCCVVVLGFDANTVRIDLIRTADGKLELAA